MSGLPSHRAEITTRQLALVRRLVARTARLNQFYRDQWKSIPAGAKISSLAQFCRVFPLTEKASLTRDQEDHPPFGRNHARPLEDFTRFHQTSGTTGHPLRWLDTPLNWAALVRNWVEIFEAADVRRGDRLYFAFSFGPFIGFWLAFDAAQKIGALCVPGGGLGSVGRVHAILDNQVTVLCCTPTYALRLAEVAHAEKIDLQRSKVRRIIVAGEPGGSNPAIRARIESAWPGARVFDHHGMTEVGPVTYECPRRPGFLHVIESAYLPEVIDPKSLAPVPNGQAGELILTTLTRADSPLIRYRTGDLVAIEPADKVCVCGRSEMSLAGGILSRVDDMLVIRGVNIFPSAVENVLAEFPGIVEFQVKVTRSNSLSEARIHVELSGSARFHAALAKKISKRLQAVFNLRIPVEPQSAGKLPRFEMKARRWIFS